MPRGHGDSFSCLGWRPFWTLVASWLSPTWSGTTKMRYRPIFWLKSRFRTSKFINSTPRVMLGPFLGHFGGKILGYFGIHSNCRVRKLFRVQVDTWVCDASSVSHSVALLCVGSKSHFHSEAPSLRPLKNFHTRDKISKLCHRTAILIICMKICLCISYLSVFRVRCWNFIE